MSAFEQLLQDVIGRGEKTATAPASAAGSDGEFDVAAFVDGLEKSASSLDKAAEALPTPPQLAAEQLRMLNNPMGIRRDALHGQHRRFVGQVLPAARSSLGVPGDLDGIGKTAGKSGSWLLRRMGRG